MGGKEDMDLEPKQLGLLEPPTKTKATCHSQHHVVDSGLKSQDKEIRYGLGLSIIAIFMIWFMLIGASGNSSTLTFWQWYILLFSPYRYVRLIVNIVGYVLYKSIPILSDPSYSSKDVTVIIPTIQDDMEKLRGPVSSILATDIRKLIMVTPCRNYCALEGFATSIRDSRIKLCSSDVANKRCQLCNAIRLVDTPITVLADDDVT